MPQNVESEPAIVVGRAYDFVLWLLQKVENPVDVAQALVFATRRD